MEPLFCLPRCCTWNWLQTHYSDMLLRSNQGSTGSLIPGRAGKQEERHCPPQWLSGPLSQVVVIAAWATSKQKTSLPSSLALVQGKINASTYVAGVSDPLNLGALTVAILWLLNTIEWPVLIRSSWRAVGQALCPGFENPRFETACCMKEPGSTCRALVVTKELPLQSPREADSQCTWNLTSLYSPFIIHEGHWVNQPHYSSFLCPGTQGCGHLDERPFCSQEEIISPGSKRLQIPSLKGDSKYQNKNNSPAASPPPSSGTLLIAIFCWPDLLMNSYPELTTILIPPKRSSNESVKERRLR